MPDFTTTPIFPTFNVGTEYDVHYRTAPWETEQRLTGELSTVRIAHLKGDSNASAGIPMLGFAPTDGRKDIRVDIPWESVTRVGLARPWTR